MFIKSKRVKGCTYYQVEESHWVNGHAQRRVLVFLGTCPTIEAAFRKYEARYFASRQGKRRAPFTDADRKAWIRLRKLEKLLSEDKTVSYERSAAFQAEIARWLRANERANRVIEDDSWLDSMSDRTESFCAILGIPPDATLDQIKAAYRRKAREAHPDHGGSDEAMAAVNEAYESLLD